MTTDDTDRIAREAARLLATGAVPEIERAIRLAGEGLGLAHLPAPGRGLVRRHAQAMTMQALGDEGYRAHVRAIRQTAEELMTLIEQGVAGEGSTLLVGRAARGHVDGGVTLHIRVYTNCSIGELVELLVAHGCEEPRFETADTRHGRLDRARFVEGEHEVVVTRCLPALRKHAGEDLFRGRPVAGVGVEELRRRLEEG